MNKRAAEKEDNYKSIKMVLKEKINKILFIWRIEIEKAT